MKRKREKLLIPPPISSRRVARRVTSEFHQLTGPDERARARYQEASQLSTRLYSTSKWILGELRRLGRPRGETCLEIGAVNTQLLSSHLVTRAIDLKSSHPLIEELDFFDVSPGKYDVVVCSLVLNAVPDPRGRGFMLQKLAGHLRPSGLLFVVLPRACLERSTAIDEITFLHRLRCLHLHPLIIHKTKKLIHLCLSPHSDDPAGSRSSDQSMVERRPSTIRGGPANDFDVILPSSPPPPPPRQRRRRA